jgi:hypothetical protein
VNADPEGGAEQESEEDAPGRAQPVVGFVDLVGDTYDTYRRYGATAGADNVRNVEVREWPIYD